MNKSLEDDANLVDLCIKRDLSAWSALVKKYSPLISISIENRLKKYGVTLPHQEAEDIRQEILTSIWKERKLEGVKNRDNISYWLAIVSGNAAVAHMRVKRRRDPPKAVSIFDKLNERDMAEFIPSAAMNAYEELSKAELSEKIDTAIGALPSKEKLIIKLNILCGKKYDEISDILDIPKGTVSSYIKRAKEKMREALKDFLQ